MLTGAPRVYCPNTRCRVLLGEARLRHAAGPRAWAVRAVILRCGGGTPEMARHAGTRGPSRAGRQAGAVAKMVRLTADTHVGPPRG